MRFLDSLVDVCRDAPSGALVRERDAARLAFLDTIGCIAAGRRERSVAAVRAAVAALDDGGVWPADRTALVLGTAAHALDFDDVLERATAHASAVLVPTALALGGKTGASIDEMVDAYTVGYVVLYALGQRLNPDHYVAGWHATSTLGVIAAAASASRLLQLTAEATAHALSIATSMSSGVKRQFGFGAKHLHAGNAAASGIVAAQLARSGLTGNSGVFEGSTGFLHLYRGSESNSDGEGYWAAGTPSRNLWLKAYPSCAATHRPLAAMAGLIEQGLAADEVVSIVAGVAEISRRSLQERYPVGPQEAKFSLEFSLAALLLHRTVGLSTWAEEVVAEPAVRELAGRIKVKTISDGTGPECGTVEVRLADGSDRSASVHHPLGHPLAPLTREQVLQKFRECISFGGHDNVASIERSALDADGAADLLEATLRLVRAE